MLISTKKLAEFHPDAFKGLPEPYREDDCLVFWKDMNGTLCAAPGPNQAFALGEWVSMWNDNKKEWQDIPSS